MTDYWQIKAAEKIYYCEYSGLAFNPEEMLHCQQALHELNCTKKRIVQ